MKTNTAIEKLPRFIRRRPVLFGAVALVLIGLVTWYSLRPARNGLATTATYQVQRGDFTVSVVEGGTLSAVSEISIRSEVEGTARIISLVPEGSYVKKGDLLVELDSSQAQDQVNQQEINNEKAKFAVEQARAQIEIMRSSTNSDYLAAKLKLELAKIDLEKYEKGQKMVDMVEASNRVVQVRAQLSVNLDTYRNSTNLAAKGYETKQKVDGDRLNWLNTENSLIVATNGVWMLETFDERKNIAKFEADVAQAEQELARVISQNRRRMANYDADLITQENTLKLSEQKLERDKKNLIATKIFAPQDGLVVYQVSDNHFSSESLIEGGAIVRNRQELIKLPDLSRMKVTIKVHESHITLIRPGLPAYVTLDSMPDERFQGSVEKVAPLPDTQARWGNPNLKVYNTDVYLAEAVPNVKPGVSAKAEVIITNIANALSVPIQAVTSLKGKQIVYVVRGGRTEPRPVTLGMYNTKFIQILDGLKEGEFVLLSPPVDTQENDIEGGVLNPEEKARLAPTNAPPQRSPEEPGAAPGPITGPIVNSENPVPGVTPNMQASAGDQRGPGGFDREAFRKQFDKNGDGQLDDSEREAMQTAMAARRGQGGRGGALPEELIKRFDKNNDGKLDEAETEAMRASFGNRQRGEGRGNRRGNEQSPGGGSQPERAGGPTLSPNR